MQKRFALAALAMAGAMGAASPAFAYEKEFEEGAFDGWLLQWRTRVSAGAAWRRATPRRS